MAPTDDEHKSANDAEENTSKSKNVLKFWKRRNEDDREPARLKTLPKCLMHWITPVLIAAIGFLIALAFAVNWHGTFHWPSADAMKLCATIAGAGFAFSAWQQRSHDNVVKEDEHAEAQRKREAEREEREQAIRAARDQYEAEREEREQAIRAARDQYEAEREEREQTRIAERERYEAEREEQERNRLEQIERDEYWKRREQAYSLLSSNNPNIRLGAIELLIELGDIANKSNAENTAKTQEFLQHIVTILCNQVRYEGLSIPADGTLEQHAYLQGQILQKLLKRADNSSSNNRPNGWTACTIDLSDSILNIEIQIHNATIKQPLVLTDTTFNKPVSITHSSLHELHWTNSHFNHLTTSNSSLKIDSFPAGMKNAEFSQTTFHSHSDNESAALALTLTDAKADHSHTNIISFNKNCSFESPLFILANSGRNKPNFSSERLNFTGCNFTSTEITGSNFNAYLQFETCTFKGPFKIHKLIYELGAVLEEECDEYDPYCCQKWEIDFPEHTTLKTATCHFSSCTFTNKIAEQITIEEIMCYYEEWEQDNNDLIVFTNNKTFNGDEISIEPLGCVADKGSNYVAKVNA